MTEITVKDLEKFLNSGYIKKGWLDNINDLSSNDILKCINRCTSPTGEDTEEKLKAIFRAFSLFPLSETKILILGQDPYTEQSCKADGCAFSVANGKKDASLLNIFKAIKAAYCENKKFEDVKKEDVNNWSYDLKGWSANRHVLLLNVALTHENTDDKIIKIHRGAWEPLICEIIKKLMSSENINKLAVFLWGKPAQCAFYNAIKMEKFEPEKYNLTRRMIFMTSHPSNRAVKKGFSKDAPCHFKACDKFLGEDIWKNFPENNTVK